jgi:hypothetical protein
MVKLTAMDEHFVHQNPEPLPQAVSHHDHWRESYTTDDGGTGTAIYEITGAHHRYFPEACGEDLPV